MPNAENKRDYLEIAVKEVAAKVLLTGSPEQVEAVRVFEAAHQELRRKISPRVFNI